jgi:cell division protein FtsL
MKTLHSQTNILSLTKFKVFYFLAAVTVVSFALYLFFIGQTVFKLVSERNTVSLNRSLASEISQLEFNSLSLDDTISIDKAYELGFVSAPKTQYVSKTSELSLR